MTVRLKRKLRGADGGKHPHVKDCQDFGPPVWTPDENRRRIRDAAADLAHVLSEKQLRKRPGVIVTEEQRRAAMVAKAAVLNLANLLK